MGSHRHFEKAGTMYDEVYRVPLLARWPEGGASGGRTEERFVRLLDLMPTLLDAAGIPIPEDIDGLSALPLLRGGTPERWPDSVYAEHNGEVWGYQTQRMVRTHRWKYVYSPHDLDELYDLQADPYEMNNLIRDEASRPALDEMQARLAGWWVASKDMFTWGWVVNNLPEPRAPF